MLLEFLSCNDFVRMSNIIKVHCVCVTVHLVSPNTMMIPLPICWSFHWSNISSDNMINSSAHVVFFDQDNKSIANRSHQFECKLHNEESKKSRRQKTENKHGFETIIIFSKKRKKMSLTMIQAFTLLRGGGVESEARLTKSQSVYSLYEFSFS